MINTIAAVSNPIPDAPVLLNAQENQIFNENEIIVGQNINIGAEAIVDNELPEDIEMVYVPPFNEVEVDVVRINEPNIVGVRALEQAFVQDLPEPHVEINRANEPDVDYFQLF